MLKKITLILSLLFLFTSCSSDYDKRLKISATTWIGYTPLFYAKEKGWLKPLNIKLLHVSSLAENMYLYQAGNSDAYVGTQYEYSVMSKNMKSLTPVMMFDKSNGGDLVMGNMSIEDFQKTTKEIDVYLELDSINNIVIKDFLSKYKLKDKKINYINEDQTQIEQLHSNSKPTLIVTYIPYDVTLKKQGFMKLASTKGSLDLLVVDAMFTKSETYDMHQEQFRELKSLVDKSVEVLKNNPKDFYLTIKPYMLEISYDDFLDSLDDVIWINRDISPELKMRMNKANFPIRDLM